MSGWHPNQDKGGVAPNPANPFNPPQALSPSTPATMAAPTYYADGCNNVLTPSVINSLISELLAVLDRVGIPYNPNVLTNVRNAVEYIVQRGIPRYAVLEPQGDPPYYFRNAQGTVDPPITGLNNGMALIVVPTATNRGWVRVDVGNGQWVPVLRMDGAELEREDWPEFVPQEIAYYNGSWYQIGLSKSMVPLVLKGAISFWIRPDGSDSDGDGVENTPQRAFRTIDGAWHAVGTRFAGSPGAHIILRLGIPGEYEGGIITSYGSNVTLYGDPGNPAGYRVHTKVALSPTGQVVTAISLWASNVAHITCMGVNLVMDSGIPSANGTQCFRCSKSTVTFDDCRFSIETNNPTEGYVIILENSSEGWLAGNVVVAGNGRSIYSGISLHASQWLSSPAGPPRSSMTWENLNLNSYGWMVNSGSYARNTNTTTAVYNVTGPRYYVGGWSSLDANGQPIPGSSAGTTTPQGIYSP